MPTPSPSLTKPSATPVCRKNTAAAAPVINVSNFLRELVLVLPGTVHAHASILLPHLSSRPYQIRNAVVYALAEVITAAHQDREPARGAEEGRRGSTPGDGRTGDDAVEVSPASDSSGRFASRQRPVEVSTLRQ